MSDIIRSFDETTHRTLIRMARDHESMSNSPTDLQEPREVVEQQLADGSTYWAHVVQTAPPATGEEPLSEPEPYEPVLKNPDFRTLVNGRTIDDDTEGRGLVELYRRDPLNNAFERMSATRFPLYNLAYHPIPITWVVPVTVIGGDLHVATPNLSWHLKTPEDGIPRATGNDAGHAECEIWRIGHDKKRERIEEDGEPVKTICLNWSKGRAIGGSRFIHAHTENYFPCVIVDFC